MLRACLRSARFTRLPMILLWVLFLAGCSPVQKTKDVFHGMKPGRSSNPSPGGSADKSDREGKRIYIVIEQNGERRSSGYQIRRHSTFRGHPCVVLERVRKQVLQRGNRKFKKTINQKSITAIDGAALYASTVTIVAGERFQEIASISKGKAKFETITPTGSKSSTINVPRGIMFGIEPSWLILKGLEVGKQFTAQVLDRSRKQVVTEKVIIRGRRRESVLGQDLDAWEADSIREGTSPVRMVFTEAGDIIKLQADDIVFRIVSKQEAKRKSAPVARIVSHIRSDFPLPAWDTFSSLVYALTPASAWRKYVHDSAYTQVNDQGDKIIVTLRKKVLTPTNATLPMQIPANLRPYLASAKTIMPQNRTIQETSRRILRGEKNALRAIALIAGYIYQEIRYGSSRSLNSDPISTLENRAGDCTEHADLFASLARAQGIPTRNCLGLIIQKGKAVYHSWPEAWIAGKWIPVDTTVNRVGLPAGYLLTARGTGQGIPKDEFAWRMRRGDMKMHLVSATREFFSHNPHTLIPGSKKTYVAGEGSWLTNLYWGFSLNLPQDWSGLIKMNYVEMTSLNPRLPAKVKCEAMDQEYRMRQSTLDRIVASLKAKFSNYRTIKAKIMDLPTGPHIPGRRRSTSATLMVDFTCKTGKTLLRCRQYIIPKRGRSYRIWIAAPASGFTALMPYFRSIVDSLEL